MGEQAAAREPFNNESSLLKITYLENCIYEHFIFYIQCVTKNRVKDIKSRSNDLAAALLFAEKECGIRTGSPVANAIVNENSYMIRCGTKEQSRVKQKVIARSSKKGAGRMPWH
jgi:uncharacterized protein (DUF2344 family)